MATRRTRPGILSLVRRSKDDTPEAFDPYAGVEDRGDEYDPRGFYVHSTNRYDHSVYRKDRFPPDIVAEVERIIASGDLAGTPIKSWGAFVRDAVVHNLHRISRLTSDPMTMQAAANARRIARIQTLDREREEFATLVVEAREKLARGEAARDVTFVETVLDMYTPMVESLREPYSGQLVEVLKNSRRWLAGQNAK